LSRRRLSDWLGSQYRAYIGSVPGPKNECQTPIAATRGSAGKSAAEILAACDAAGAQFDANVAAHFARKGDAP
jgi:hypothetical protein